MISDTRLFLWINGLSGKSYLLDEFFKGLANDYFLLVSICLFLAFLWFGTREKQKRESVQRTILLALIGIGFASGLVTICNQQYFRVRPFNVLPEGTVNLLFYRPTDSSFPSNFAAVLFAIAVAFLIKNKKTGGILLGIAFLGGFSRIFVGVHYPLDVLGGAAAGATGSVAAYAVTLIIEPITDFVLKLLRLIHLA